MQSLVDQYTILRNCRNWHAECFDQTTEEHNKRRHKHQMNLLDKRIAVLEDKLGLKNAR